MRNTTNEADRRGSSQLVASSSRVPRRVPGAVSLRDTRTQLTRRAGSSRPSMATSPRPLDANGSRPSLWVTSRASSSCEMHAFPTDEEVHASSNFDAAARAVVPVVSTKSKTHICAALRPVIDRKGYFNQPPRGVHYRPESQGLTRGSADLLLRPT